MLGKSSIRSSVELGKSLILIGRSSIPIGKSLNFALTDRPMEQLSINSPPWSEFALDGLSRLVTFTLLGFSAGPDSNFKIFL